jgi:hypothetical protein
MALQIIDNQQNIVANFHQDSMAKMQSGFFQGHMRRGLFFLPNYSEAVFLAMCDHPMNEL